MLFLSVPSDLITSVSLSTSNQTGNVGSSVSLTCTAVLSVNVTWAMIEFDYGLGSSNTVAAVAGTTQTDVATLSPVTISSAGNYACSVTVTAPGVCGGGGSEPACPTRTSDPVALIVHCELCRYSCFGLSTV